MVERVDDGTPVDLKDVELGSDEVLILWDMPTYKYMYRCQLCHRWVCRAEAKVSICRPCAMRY